jgi:hypothetical protein
MLDLHGSKKPKGLGTVSTAMLFQTAMLPDMAVLERPFFFRKAISVQLFFFIFPL